MSNNRAKPRHERKEAILRFIETEGHRKASQRMQDVRFLTIEPDRIAASEGTADHTVFTRAADGIIHVQPDHGLHTAISPAYQKRSLFNNIWHSILNEAETRLTAEVDAIVPAADWQTPGETAGPDYVASLLRTARAIAAQTGGQGYVNNPQALGARAIAQLAGPDNVSMTLKLFGGHATVQHLNSFIANRHCLTAAYTIQPNAAIAHALHCLEEHRTDQPQAGQPDTPEAVIQRAKEMFEAAARESHPETDPEPAWRCFMKLSPLLVRESASYRWRSIVRVACQAAQAGAIPSCTAARTIRAAYGLNDDHPELIQAYIRASARKGAAQKRLARQFARLIMTSPTWNNPDPDHGANETEWNAILRRAGIEDTEPEAGNEQHDLILRRRRPGRPAPRRRRTTPADRVKKTEEGRRQRSRLDAIAAAMKPEADGAIIFRHTPDLITVSRPGRPQPDLAITRHQDGTLSINGPAYDEALTALPDPDRPDPEAAGIPTGRGIFHQHVLEMAQQKAGSRQVRQLANIALEQWAGDESFRRRNFDQSLDQRLAHAIAKMMNPEAARLCLKLTGRLALTAYNAVIRWRSLLPELSRTNPGITALAFHHPDLAGRRFNHAGQLVTALKERYGLDRNGNRQPGMTRSQWRFIANLPPETIQAAFAANRDSHRWTDHHYPAEELALNLLKAMADAGARLDDEQIRRLRPAILSIGPQSPDSAVLPPALAILCRDAANGIPLPGAAELNDIGDYLRAIAAEDHTPLTARTVNGLAKASRRWHRLLAAQRLQREWSSRVKQEGELYPAWNDLLGSIRFNDFEIVPLTSARELMQESITMNHCVGYAGYDQPCVQGNSRIFSIRKDGRPQATTQLVRQGKRWQAVQTRGQRNAPADEAILEAAQHLARAYGQAQAQPGCQPLRSWKQPETGSEPALNAPNPLR